jgi:hypothetical protein
MIVDEAAQSLASLVGRSRPRKAAANSLGSVAAGKTHRVEML